MFVRVFVYFSFLLASFAWLGGWRPTMALMLGYSLMGMQMAESLPGLLEGGEVPSMAALSHAQVGRVEESLSDMPTPYCRIALIVTRTM